MINDEKEIQLLKAIYSRLKIKIGKESFTPNIGVAQGSLISPALFNIYAEDLYKTLDNAGIAPDDQMGYADDLFILCSSKSELKSVISVVKTWCSENNLALNAAKSGIVEFLPRRGRKKTLHIGQEYEGIPICERYKYLGMWVDQKLYMDTQVQQIKKKADWISIKLWPVLKRVSMQYCKNLWTILIRPLFEQLTILYNAEKSKTNKGKIELALRYTFKKFTLLKRNTSTDITHDLMQFNIDERSMTNTEIAKQKWEARLAFSSYTADRKVDISQRPQERKTRFLPKELQQILNLMVAKCPKCKGTGTRICSKQHLEQQHQIIIPTYADLIKSIETKTAEAKRMKLNRTQTAEHVGSFIKVYINCITQFLDVQNT